MTQTYQTLDIQISGSIAHMTLDRPEARNAMSDVMVAEILDFFDSIRDDRSIRAVIIAAAGSTFCSGGDIKDMQASIHLSDEERDERLHEFDRMLHAVNEAPQVTIARIQGAAMGGGTGLVCVSDIAIASDEAVFGLPEVRLGIAPALISPYAIARLGISRTRQLMLTGRRFDAHAALDYGLIHEICEPDELDNRVDEYVNDIRQCSPNALAETKRLIFQVWTHPPEESRHYRIALNNRLRESEDGQEGMQAFIQKRKPYWASNGKVSSVEALKILESPAEG